MVQFLKAKPTSFINKPVGIVNTDTGGQKAGQVLANVANNLAGQFFKEATDQQIKRGQEYALTLPVRDENNNLVFQPIDSTLSTVAREAAEPLIKKRYGEALSVDITKRINDLRLSSKTSGEFNEKTQAFMGAYIDQISDLGGSEYKNIITENVAKLSTQHFYAMATEEMKEQLQVAALNSLTITNQNIKDIEASSSQDLIFGFPDEDLSFQQTLEIYNENIKSELNRLEENRTSNNLNFADYTKAKKGLETSIARGLLKKLASTSSHSEFVALKNNIENGAPLPAEFQIKLEKSGESGLMQTVLDYVKQVPHQEFISDEMGQLRTNLSVTQSSFRNDESYQRQQYNYYIQEINNDPNNFTAKNTFAELRFKIANDLITNFDVNGSLEQKDIDTFISGIAQTTRREGVNVGDGRRVIFSDAAASSLQTSALTSGLVRMIERSGKFTTSSSLSVLRNAIINNTDTGLTDEQKKVKDKIVTIQERFNLKEILNDSLTPELTKKITSLNTTETESNKILERNLQTTNGINGKSFDNSPSSQQLRNEGLGNPDYTYFVNQFAQKLKEGDEEAIAIDKTLSNGAMITSFTNLLTNATRPNASPIEVETAINMFKKYGSFTKDGSTVDLIMGNIDSDTYATLAVASNLIPNYEGAENFFGVTNPNGGPVTSSQMMRKIIETGQMMSSESTQKDLFDTNRRAIFADNKIKNSTEFLINQDFEKGEAAELSFVVDLAAGMGMKRDETIKLLDFIKAGLYVDGEGMIIDKLGSGKNMYKSKYSFLKVFPDANSRAIARGVIQKDLDKLGKKNKLGEVEGKFILNHQPSRVIDGKVQFNLGTNVGVKITAEDTPVYLQPYQYGTGVDNVRYVAIVKDGMFYRPLQNPDGGLLVYDSNKLRGLQAPEDM